MSLNSKSREKTIACVRIFSGISGAMFFRVAFACLIKQKSLSYRRGGNVERSSDSFIWFVGTMRWK